MNLKAILIITIALIHLACIPSSAQKNGNEPIYDAGFVSLKLVDSSRIYRTPSSVSDSLHYRPVDLDIWYPGQMNGEKQLAFKDLFLLFEQRATRYGNGKNYKGIVNELAQFYVVELGLKASDGLKLLELPTESYNKPIAADKRFPVIIYMAGMNGMGFENFRLLERLARQGFIVVSIWSVGRYPGDMTNQKEDMLEQVYDAEFATKFLRSQKLFKADFTEVGVVGCSWGGMSAAAFIKRNPAFRTFVSLDGTETHYFGDADQDDEFIQDIYNSGLLNPDDAALRYLYLESGNKLEGASTVSEYNYFKKLASKDKFYLRFLKSRHEDFISIPSALHSSPTAVEIHGQIMELTTEFFQQNLKGTGDFTSIFDKLSNSTETSPTPFNIKYADDVLLISGKINDAKTGLPLSFVNVGILNREIGTVSDDSGRYELKVNPRMKDDTVRISMIGYKAQVFKVNELLSLKRQTIALEEDNRQLSEVVVTAKLLKQKNIGNRSTSQFVSTGFGYKQLGAEIGIRINVKHSPTFADAFHFNISYNRLSAKAFFRLNVYSIKKGRPFESILAETIIVPVNAKQTGRFSVDLKPYNIIFHEDVIVTLEWIKNEGSNSKGEAIFFSVGMLNSGTLVRLSSQGKFKKFGSLGVGMNLDVRY